MASPVGTSIFNCKGLDHPTTDSSPSGFEFPYGFFEFTINGVANGGATNVTLHLPAGKTFDTYYKYGPTPSNDIDHWYEFLNDGETGAEINENLITLYFLDGSGGDDDLTANGTVIDIGGPARATTTATTTPDPGDGESGGGGCLITAANQGQR